MPEKTKIIQKYTHVDGPAVEQRIDYETRDIPFDHNLLSEKDFEIIAKRFKGYNEILDMVDMQKLNNPGPKMYIYDMTFRQIIKYVLKRIKSKLTPRFVKNLFAKKIEPRRVNVTPKSLKTLRDYYKENTNERCD